MDALSSSLTTMTTRVSDAMRSTSSVGTAVIASSAIGDGGESELQKIAAKRSSRFVETFGRQCVDATRANVRDAEERLRETALNAAISCEASATSDLPTLERATKAMRCEDDAREDDSTTKTKTTRSDENGRKVD